ncbi:DUF3006 family protein [Deinococcus misasensis]|uniref:DUF3006 family protein n=1 Tax=Deinococcus misasensis TaxID=392413 RepID=UPI000554FCC0|nr:DUF3006 family protein [Deinococcus misasensis]
MTQWIVEGFENGFVRLEHGDHLLDFPVQLLPQVKVGDVLFLEQEAGWFRFVLDEQSTRQAQQEAITALADLNADAPEGDLKI